MTSFVALAAGLCLLSFALLVRPAWWRPSPTADKPSRRMLLGLAVLMAGVTAGGYAWIGSPDGLSMRPGVPTTPTEQVAVLLRQLESRVKKDPGDAAAWGELARGNVAVGRSAEGLEAFRKALALRPDDPDLLTDYADVLAVSNNRNLAGEPTALIERALKANPNHLKALSLSGMAALKRQDYGAALAAWDKAVRLAPPDDPLAAQLRGVLAQVRQQAAAGGASAPASGAR